MSVMCGNGGSATEAIEGAALTLESIDDIEGGDSLALGVFGVGDGVTNDSVDMVSIGLRWQEEGDGVRFEEGLEDTSGLFVDHSGNALYSSSSCESTWVLLEAVRR